jgi:hypothetical protein
MVLAAHQYLSANGKCGFVDENGSPNPDYSSSAERMKAFKEIGESVLSNFFNKEVDK